MKSKTIALTDRRIAYPSDNKFHKFIIWLYHAIQEEFQNIKLFTYHIKKKNYNGHILAIVSVPFLT